MLGQNDNINLEVNDKKSVILRLFGNYYILIIAVMIGLGIIYLNNIDFFSVNNVITGISGKDTSKSESDLPMLKGSISPPVDVAKLSVSSSELVERGKKLFETNCISCHGPEGKGDGVAAGGLNPKPRNFTDLSGWKNGPKLTQIYKTLQEGIPGSAMASFSTIPPEDRFALIHYLQTFRNDYPKVTDADLKDLDKVYSLSSGVKTPNQIPVKLAEEKVINDNKVFEDKVRNIASSVEKESSVGALVFKKISKDIQKSVRTLLSNSRWNENESEFVNFIGTEQIYNGFTTKVYELTPQETTTVFQYLRNLFANYKI
jgi:mono/diheme cytochrome c family protein